MPDSATNDRFIVEMIHAGRLHVDLESGKVFAPRSNTPNKPLGTPTRKGYLRTSIYTHGKSQCLMVHRIVWIAAYGCPPDPTLEIDHVNGDKVDNRPANLALVTSGENINRATAARFYRNNGMLNKEGATRDTKGRFVGKKTAGRLLDGAEWNQFPDEVPA